MMAAFESNALPVRAVVSYYGPVDLTDGYRNPPSPDPLDVRAIEEALLGGTPDQVPERYREASPISYVARRLPPSPRGGSDVGVPGDSLGRARVRCRAERSERAAVAVLHRAVSRVGAPGFMTFQ